MSETVGKVTLDDTYYPGEDLYSDGAIEDVLLEIAQKYEEKDFDRVVAEYENWPVLYHFSHVRTNIITWLLFTGKERALEIGSGCGAITGALADRVESVDCIDLSKKRSMVNAYRNQNRDNIVINVGNFQDIEQNLQKKYDLITLIGVFEYANGYIGGEAPYVDFLKKIKKHLAPGGKIVIAIENRLGLKYWAGATEDHTGTYYEGLEGYPTTNWVKTFSRSELIEVVEQAGGLQYQFYYPYPDYKLPMSIYSDRHLPKVGELTQNVTNFDRERMAYFSEEKVYDSLIESGLFPLYSNSFFLILQEGGQQENIIYTKFSNERAMQYNIRTNIGRNEQGKHEVTKVADTISAKGHIQHIADAYKQLNAEYAEDGIKINICEQDKAGIKLAYIDGQTLEKKLDLLLARKEYAQMEHVIAGYFATMTRSDRLQPFKITEEFKQIFGKIKFKTEQKSQRVTDIDMVFSNIIIEGDQWNLIDYEWTFDFPIPVKFVLYRCIHYYIETNTKRNELRDCGWYEKAGLTQEECEIFARMEEAFQRYIVAGHVPIRDLYPKISKGIISVLPMIQETSRRKQDHTVQVYFDMGEGLTEENSKIITMNDNKESFTVTVPKGTQMVRIDPCVHTCIFEVQQLTSKRKDVTYTTNCIPITNNRFFSPTNDPQIIIQKEFCSDKKEITVLLEVEFVDEMTCQILQEQFDRINAEK